MNLLLYTGILLALLWWIEPFSFPFVHRKNPGDALELWLGQRGLERKEEGQLPPYKFYSELIVTILETMRKFGGSTKEALLFVREGLQQDLQFEKRIKELRLGTLLQMFLMALITWLFIYFSLKVTEVTVMKMGLLGIFLWQLLGLLLLPLLMGYFRKRYFHHIGRIWKTLFILKSLERTPLPRSEVFRLSGIQDIESISSKKLGPVVLKIKRLCHDCLKLGKSYETDLKNLMEELRFIENWHFSLFEKRLGGIKLLLLGLFFLPSYLGFIILLIGSLNL